MAKLNTEELTKGLAGLAADLLTKAREDLNVDVIPAAMEIGERATYWAQRALSGDPDAEGEMLLLKAEVEIRAATVTRKAHHRVVDEILQAFLIALKFAAAAGPAAWEGEGSESTGRRKTGPPRTGSSNRYAKRRGEVMKSSNTWA